MSSSKPYIKGCAVWLVLAVGCSDGKQGGGVAETIADSAADAVVGDATPEAEVAPDATEPDSADSAAPDAVADTAVADTSAPEVIVPAGEWDPEPVRTMDCAPDRAMPLMDALLAQAGLTRDTFTFSADDYAGSRYFSEGLLEDPFRLSSFRAIQAAPLQAGCFADEAAGALDDVLAGGHPVAAMIRRASKDLDRFADGAPRLPEPDASRGNIRLAAAVSAACAAAGVPFDASPDLFAPLPEELAFTLVPIFVAMGDALAAQRAMAEAAPTLTARQWVEEGGIGLVPSAAFSYMRKDNVRLHLEGKDTLPPLFLAAARVAYAIESVDWRAHAGIGGAHDITTPIGRIVIGGPGPDTYEQAAVGDAPIWFLLDVGGDDVHRDEVGSSQPALGVSVAIDLGGDDYYGYAASVDPVSGLKMDDHGRYAPGDRATSNGAITRSRHGRQGAGRHGIGLLFDLGGGDDRYDSLAASQGYAHMGVGVLFDDGGSDTYLSEVASQGAAMCGIGLLIDAGAGADTYTLTNSGQGFGGTRGIGILFDGGGDDRYDADPGPVATADPATAPQPLYWSPQMAGSANTSMAQGASTGLRWDAAGIFLSGGRGILRDAGGDDTYRAGLFAQGSGYWQGIGLLSDGGGADQYDALYYVQGAGAHYAVGILADGGAGGDRFNQVLSPQYMQIGSGHDFTLGVLINEAGDDLYSYAGLAAGSSNCNGLGLLVDNAGDDTYIAASDYSSGLGNVSDECFAARPLPKSVGLMLDAGGSDDYLFPDATTWTTPSEGGTWGHVTHDLPSEHGAGRDGDGESGIHAP